MITKEHALALKHRQTLEHTTLKNADGTPLRARVNGKTQTWKTRPAEFCIPIKHGIRECAYITEKNASQWTLQAAGGEA